MGDEEIRTYGSWGGYDGGGVDSCAEKKDELHCSDYGGDIRV
jgi:hypothetical protein